MTKPFSIPYKQKMIERLTGNSPDSARKVSAQTGISQQTLSRWLQEARSVPDVPAKKKRTAKTWTVDEKVRVLGEAATMNGAQLTGLLEREGFLLAELEQWRLALGDEVNASLAATKRIRQLERELARKEKALAEGGRVAHSKKRSGASLGGLQWLGIIPSFSRPHVSDDNPYSEALFRTLKYTPAYPRHPFACLAAAQAWVARFVGWYNDEHRHSGIRFVTPSQRHFGQEGAILARRRALYARAQRKKPERWSRTTRNWTAIEAVVLHPDRIATVAA